jgi:hypothetical protein
LTKYTYLLHKTKGWVGVAYDLPTWLKFDESPPRSFSVFWYDSPHAHHQTATDRVVPITKEVADIMRGV